LKNNKLIHHEATLHSRISTTQTLAIFGSIALLRIRTSS